MQVCFIFEENHCIRHVFVLSFVPAFYISSLFCITFSVCISLTVSVPLSLFAPSSSGLCSNLAVSHLVMVVPKSHFQGMHPLAEGCSAITCRITSLSLTISRETGDTGLWWTQQSWQLEFGQTCTFGARKTGLFHQNAPVSDLWLLLTT